MHSEKQIAKKQADELRRDSLGSWTCLKTPKSSNEFSYNWKRLLSTNLLRSDKQDKFPDSLKLVAHQNAPFAVTSAATLTSKGQDTPSGIKIEPQFVRKRRKIDAVSTEYSSRTRSSGSANCINNSKLARLGTDIIHSPKKEPEITKCLALDCEFVGVGENGTDDMLARVSIVNLYGDCLYDKFVAPVEEVVDYRTHVSGVRPEDLVLAEPLRKVQDDVHKLLKGKILVGHSVDKDLKVLFLYHPKRDIRDTSKYRAFRRIAKTRFPSLKKLASLVLGMNIQTGEHDSVTDARATMQLYRTERKSWEKMASFRRRTSDASCLKQEKCVSKSRKTKRSTTSR